MILKMHEDGYRGDEIARKLKISENTVSKYLKEKRRESLDKEEDEFSSNDVNAMVEDIAVIAQRNIVNDFGMFEKMLDILEGFFINERYKTIVEKMAWEHGIFYEPTNRNYTKYLIRNTSPEERRVLVDFVEELYSGRQTRMDIDGARLGRLLKTIGLEEELNEIVQKKFEEAEKLDGEIEAKKQELEKLASSIRDAQNGIPMVRPFPGKISHETEHE